MNEGDTPYFFSRKRRTSSTNHYYDENRDYRPTKQKATEKTYQKAIQRKIEENAILEEALERQRLTNLNNLTNRHQPYNNKEVKYNDTIIENDGGNIHFNLLNGISEGTDNTNRIGRTIYIKSIQYRLIQTYQGGADQTDATRIIIMTDKNPEGKDPTEADLLQYTDSNRSIISPINLNNKYRFSILSDKTIQTEQNTPQVTYTQEFRRTNITTTYNYTNETITSISENALYMVIIPQTKGGGPTRQSITRIRFTD